MNNLNSILLEGKIAKKAVENADKSVSFTLVSERWIHHAGDQEPTKQETIIKVMVHGLNTGTALKFGVVGNSLRVVGRIASDEKKHIYIVAEHIEWRPGCKTAEGNDK
jgi:hypothetical protein